MSIYEITKIREFKNRLPIFGRNVNCGAVNPTIIELTERTIQYLMAWRDGYREGYQMYRNAGVTWPFIDL